MISEDEREATRAALAAGLITADGAGDEWCMLGGRADKG